MPDKFENINSNSNVDDEILQTAADMIHTEIEMDIIDHEKKDVVIPKDLDAKMLELMKTKDQEITVKNRKSKRNKFMKIAAILLPQDLLLWKNQMHSNKI